MTLTATASEAGTDLAWMLLPESCSVICTMPALAAFVVCRAAWVALPDWAMSVSDGYDLAVYSKYAVDMLETDAAVPQFTLMKSTVMWLF